MNLGFEIWHVSEASLHYVRDNAIGYACMGVFGGIEQAFGAML